MAANVNLDETSLLLTRPIDAAQRFCAQVEKEIGTFSQVVVSPLIRIDRLEVDLPPEAGEDIIFTSENGVTALGALGPKGARAWCVGERTAECARAEGYVVEAVASNAELLSNMIADLPVCADFVHVAGRHRRGDIVDRVKAAGKRARVIEAYDQATVPLGPEASALLQRAGDVVTALFSPRSAQLLARASADRRARLHAVAISEAAAANWLRRPGETLLVALTPDAAGVLSAMGSLFDADRSA